MEISYCISRQESLENNLIETILDHKKRGIYELKRPFWSEWDEKLSMLLESVEDSDDWREKVHTTIIKYLYQSSKNIR